jgi:two-component system phosphate regulon sensor histidine kinase PhoR
VETLRLYQVVDIWEKARRENAQETETLDLLNRGQSLQVIASPLGGVLQGSILLIFQDLTRVRQLETIRRDFVSNISHELRTPLASLKALTETLLDGALDDPPAARRFLSRFETEVDSLSLMVSELLELTRIESGRVPLEFEPVRPEMLIQGAVERLYLQAERAGLHIEIEENRGLPAVLADPPRMQQVLMNLLHNAIKFTPVGGRITLAAEPEAGGVVFRIRDTGVGIPAEDLPRIFERFYKADRARSGGGTGLGLAISKHLVEAHGGRIWAESVQGGGSTFYFFIPGATSR